MADTNMSPVDWAKRPLQKYADFSGRAPRAEYWWYTLAVIVLTLVVSIVEGIVGLDGAVGPYGLLSLVLMLALIVPGLAVSARRLHDTNRSAKWLLLLVPYLITMVVAAGAVASGSMTGLAGAGALGLIAMACAIALLVFMVLPSTPGDNRYGPNPYGGSAGATLAA